MMNIFRLTGDILHLLSIGLLLYKIMKLRNARNISLKTQQLYLLVFLTRYSDLFTSFYSVYITVMKIFFLATSFVVVYFIIKPYRATYNKDDDIFPSRYLILGAIVCAFIFKDKWSVFELLWTFSIFLESVAIMPQLQMMRSSGGAEALTFHYIFLLGGYRTMYLFNWVYRYIYEGYTPYNAWIAGIIQTTLYADFFYIYVKKVWKAGKESLPFDK